MLVRTPFAASSTMNPAPNRVQLWHRVTRPSLCRAIRCSPLAHARSPPAHDAHDAAHSQPAASNSEPCSTSYAQRPAEPWDQSAEAAAFGLLLALQATPAWADDALSYNPQGGEGIVKGFSGLLYVGLLVYFLYRTLNRNARRAREEVCGQAAAWGAVQPPPPLRGTPCS